MKRFDWDESKNVWLQKARGISFEEVELAINRGGLLDEVKHYNHDKYSNQKILIVEFNDYAYLVPFVDSGDTYFLKTIFPSRKATKKYLK
jgi:uncharacterized DUF497 family protein